MNDKIEFLCPPSILEQTICQEQIDEDQQVGAASKKTIGTYWKSNHGIKRVMRYIVLAASSAYTPGYLTLRMALDTISSSPAAFLERTTCDC